MFLITCNFVENSTLRDTTFPFQKYTVYTIKISTENKSWMIYKRYSEFLILHKKLEKLFHQLPIFPKKKFLKTSTKVINERIIFLEYYLNEALKQIDSKIFSKLFEFVNKFLYLDNLKKLPCVKTIINEINPNSAPKSNSFLISSTQTQISDSDKKVKFITSRDEECLISIDILKKYCPIVNYFKETLAKFIDSLSSEDANQIETCRTFFNYLLSNWTNYKKDDILLLFFGNDNHKLGLVYYSGRVLDNPIGSRACLELLYNILKLDVNPDFDYYSGLFKYGKVSDIQHLNFSHYYELKKFDSLNICFRLLKIWLLSYELKKITPRKILKDDQLVVLYESFALNIN